MFQKSQEFIKSFLIAIVIALIFRSFFFEPFYIPSGSMKDNLLVGDYVFVSKYSYGYSRYSLPLGLPIIPGRIFASAPQRGDVIVFKLPSDNSTNYIKRLIGFPGDKIQMINGVLQINGKAIPKEADGTFLDENPATGQVTEIPRYKETLPNGLSYTVLDADPNHDYDTTDIYEVPKGHYFMMGDNRDNSTDSRYLTHVGYVPEQNLLGPAKTILFSSTGSFITPWNWISQMRWSRFFTSITRADKIPDTN